MRWIGEIREQPWRITFVAVSGLLVAILIAGIVGFVLNRNVEQVVEEALTYDVDLEDEGDDLRAAVLDLRHYHRNITFGGPSRTQIENFEDAYARLDEELTELEELGVRDPDAPQPEEVRRTAEEYYADFRPAMELPETDPRFTEASDRGLAQIDEMANAGEELDELGEQLSEESLARVDRATTTATVVLLAVIGGLLLVGAALAYAAVRVVGELRRLNAEQQAVTKKLAEVSQAKTDFIADVSHELRTPLTVLRGNAEVGLLERDGAHQEILEEIVEESTRMTKMVEDLLFLARSDSATVPLDLEQVPAATFLAEVAGRAEVLARERGAQLEAKLLLGEGELEIDQRRIEQVVLILIDNAAKYGPPDGRIALSSKTYSGELCVAVADEGPGIPEADLPHIFERFYRVDKTRARKQGGTGLGLPIAKTIIDAHGGRIEAESRVGDGTKMLIYLPLSAESRPAGEVAGRISGSADR
jgi:two-component system sensor histidine kinase VicK